MPKLFALLFLINFLYAEQILKIALSQNAGKLNPQGYNFNQMYAQNMLYEGLVKIDKNGNLIPSLATSWHVSKDGLRYSFSLRKHVRFSNGEPFNAKAVEKNFLSILKNRARHSWSALCERIDKVEVGGEYEITLVLKKPYIATLDELAFVRPFRFIAPSMIPDDLDLVKNEPIKPIGTGPYMLVDSRLGVSDTFEKNPYYWDSDRIYFDKIVAKVILEPNSKIMALRTSQVDMIYGDDEIPIEIFKNMADNKQFKTYISKPIFTQTLVLNPKRINKETREAITKGIDKGILVKSVFYGYQIPANRLFYFTGKDDALGFDIAGAKRIIESLGFKMGSDGYFYKNGEILSFDLMFIANNPAQKSMAQILQAQLKELGIYIKLSGSEENIYRNKQLSSSFDISFSQTWGLPYEPFSMLHSMLRAGHVDYVILNSLPNKDDIFKAISNLSKDSLPKVLEKISDSRVYIPLVFQSNKAIAKSDILGIDMGMQYFEIPFWEFYRK